MTYSSYTMRMLPIAMAIAAILTATGARDAYAQQGWTQIQAATSTLKGICVATPSTGYAVGDNGTIVATADGGTTWSPLASGVDNNLWTVRFSSGTTGIAGGDSGTIITTIDGGITWTRRQSGLQRGAFDSFIFGLYTRDGRTWYAAGGDGAAGGGVMLRSSDSGVTWAKTPITGSFFMDRCDFADEMTGFAVGLSATGGGVIVRTTDGGATWKANHTSASLVSGIHVIDASTIVAVGSNGMVARTTDGGTTWKESMPTSANLIDVDFSDAMNGVVAGDNGTVIATNDGGVSWHDLSPGNGELLSDVAIAPGSHAIFVAGDGGRIYRHAQIASVRRAQTPAAPGMVLAPNPMRTTSTLRVDGTAAHVVIYDIQGRSALSRQLAAGEAWALDRSMLAAGRYLYVVLPEHGTTVHGMLVVE